MIAAPPTNTSAKVPMNSATKWRRLSRMSGPGLVLVRAFQDDRRVDTAESKGIAERVLDVFLAPHIGDVVEVASFPGSVEVQRRWEPLPLERECRNRELESAGCPESVAVIRLRAADLELLRVIAEHLPDGGGLDGVIQRRRAAVRVHIRHVARRDVTVVQRELHRARGLRGVGAGRG